MLVSQKIIPYFHILNKLDVETKLVFKKNNSNILLVLTYAFNKFAIKN